MDSGWNRGLQGRASAPKFFELACEVGLLFVAQTGGSFFDGGAVAQQFNGPMLSLLGQPDSGRFAHVFDEVPAQGVAGDTTVFCQCGDRPFGLPRQFRPVLNVLQARVHKRRVEA